MRWPSRLQRQRGTLAPDGAGRAPGTAWAGKNVIDFDLIESQFRHLMRVAVSARGGVISSATLLKRLRPGSHKNATYTAFHEVGRVNCHPIVQQTPARGTGRRDDARLHRGTARTRDVRTADAAQARLPTLTPSLGTLGGGSNGYSGALPAIAGSRHVP